MKVGYKSTSAGLIPAEWQVQPLGELATVSAGATPSRSVPRYWGGNIPWITTSEVGLGVINHAEQFITKLGLSSSAAKLLPPGTLLMALYGQGKTRGKVGMLEIVAATNQACAAITPRRAISKSYLLHFLTSRYEAIRSLSNTGSQENLNSALVRSIPIVLPSKDEQDAIAAALTDVDAFIDALVALIAKKRFIKQGAMQALLTGRLRLPGFDGDWRIRQLGEVIAQCSSGATPYRGRSDYYRGPVRWITSGELNYNVIMDTVEHLSSEAVHATNLKVHPPGTFLMAITGLEAAGTRGACGIVGRPATTNQSCMAIYPTAELATRFLYHYYVLRGSELALEYCQGTKQQSYTATLVKLLPIALPPTISEQGAISATLDDMDAEIAALDARLGKARFIKQGMMDDLLTGRVRLT